LNFNATVFNPSQASVDLGGITFSITYEDQNMGQTTIESLSLQPGSNFLSFFGYVQPENLTAGGEFFSKYLRGEDTLVACSGLNSSMNVNWIRSLVASLTLNSVYVTLLI